MRTASATRAALLTPPGAGAIAVVRVVGPDPQVILDRIFRPRRSPRDSMHEPNRLRYGDLFDGDEIIDDVLVCSVPTPEGWAVDLCTHGGIRVVERVLQLLEAHGAAPVAADQLADTLWPARTAIEAAALWSMVRAKTERALRFLARQAVHLPRMIDLASSLCRTDPDAAAKLLRGAIEPYRRARWLIDGVTVALVGPPNSGKSTLFNCLVGRDTAIVSATPGTTRDWVTAAVEHRGVWFTLIDTAGQHTVNDPLEQLAMIRGREAAAKADRTLLILDGSSPRPADPALSAAGIEAAGASFVIANKCDLGFAWTAIGNGLTSKPKVLRVSALRGSEVPRILEELTSSLGLTSELDLDPCAFEESQREVIDQALSELPRYPAKAADLLRQNLLASRGDPAASRGL